MASTKGYFAGLREAKTFQKGVYFLQDCKYKLKIKKTHVIETQDKGDAFIAEFEVLECSDPRHVPGFEVSWYQGLVNKNVAFGQLKLFFYACMGADPNNSKDAGKIQEIDAEIEDAMKEAVETNSLEGTVLFCQTKKAITKKNRVEITEHLWSPA